MMMSEGYLEDDERRKTVRLVYRFGLYSVQLCLDRGLCRTECICERRTTFMTGTMVGQTSWR